MLTHAEPRKVAGLILSATFMTLPKPASRRLAPLATEPTIWAMSAVRRIPGWTRRTRDDPFRIDKAETWQRVSSRALAERLRPVARVDVREQLRQCHLPVACIRFEDDRVVTTRCADEIRRSCPTAESITLPGDHLGMYHRPKRFATTVARFMATTYA